MKTNIMLLTLLVIITLWSACKDFVNDVDNPGDIFESNNVTSESQIGNLITGVQQRFATVYLQTALLADLLSDMMVLADGALNPGDPYAQIENGQIMFDNGDITSQFRNLGELRFLADNLLVTADRFNFENQNLRSQALFTANFYGGIARYLYATYSGITEKEGGGVIDGGPFIPATRMFERAITKLQAAVAYAEGDYQIRLINSVIARIYLFKGDLSNASLAAEAGLAQGDAPFKILFDAASPNSYAVTAGPQQSRFLVNARFAASIASDSDEAARLPLSALPRADSTINWRQNKYDTASAPVDFITWQENELILAEADLSAVDRAGALGHVNKVRSSFRIGELTDITLSELIGERDKTLFAQGLRLVDQRRFNLFHLPAGTWQYLPISEEERLSNPNFD